ncbi:hypothetical protein RUMTOR_00183 [[Ruminococcus] torques ATCC 27756]|uniref:Uncharacterized protein n=1 Tax=[Ruminococcus] torques ATCC 27756 TaxID=411460 RepID=A5KIY7_9FIRM|nr:hypothetical protein RUMTOR_00183 [[Ruminococcus] torques ATCC 27756]
MIVAPDKIESDKDSDPIESVLFFLYVFMKRSS